MGRAAAQPKGSVDKCPTSLRQELTQYRTGIIRTKLLWHVESDRISLSSQRKAMSLNLTPPVYYEVLRRFSECHLTTWLSACVVRTMSGGQFYRFSAEALPPTIAKWGIIPLH
jgi:hypothetical protein